VISKYTDWVAANRVRFLISSAQFELEFEFEIKKAASSMQCCQADD
jgi:hypothetical protein